MKAFALTLDTQGAATTGVDDAGVDILVSREDKALTEQLGTSELVVQNVLYDIATQVYGNHLPIHSLEALSLIFTEENKEEYGVYLYEKEQ
jgi:hypothetical protein